MPRTPQLRRLRLLHLEDSELDHQLVLAHLRRGGIEPSMQRIDTEGAFLAALDQRWDAVISDFNLPALIFVLSARAASACMRACIRGFSSILLK